MEDSSITVWITKKKKNLLTCSTLQTWQTLAKNLEPTAVITLRNPANKHTALLKGSPRGQPPIAQLKERSLHDV